MVASLSVLLTTSDPGPALATLVAAWDGQSARSDSVELVVVDAGSTDGSAARLHQLAGRRANVVVLDGSGDKARDRGRALAEASGRYVLVLDQQHRLTRRALELIDRQARETGAGLVLGRVRGPAGSGSFALARDRKSLDPQAASAALPYSLVTVVRQSLLDHEDPSAALEHPLTALPGLTVAAVGDVAVATVGGEPSPTTFPTEVLDVVARWVDGLLVVDAELQLCIDGRPDVSGWLVLAATADAFEVTVLGDLRRRGGPGYDDIGVSDTWTLHAEVDLSTVVGGEALGDGVWELRLRAATRDAETTFPLPLVELAPAVLHGRLLATQTSAAWTRLDLGSTRTSLVATVADGDASVVESSAGSLLTLRYPEVHVHGDAVVPARLRLDRFGLPSRLVCADGAARLECFVTGLAGTSVITVSTGGSGPRATGLGLDIDEVGRMSVVPASVAQPAPPSEASPQHPVARPSASVGPAAAAPASPAARLEPGSASLVRGARRRVPGVLEPVVHRLSGVGVLRRAYRALLHR